MADSKDPIIPTSAQAAPGQMTRISATVPAGGKVRWFANLNPADAIQIERYPDHVQVVPLKAGRHLLAADLVGSDDDGSVCVIDAGEPATASVFANVIPAIKAVIPSAAVLERILYGLIIAGSIAWGLFHHPAPIITPPVDNPPPIVITPPGNPPPVVDVPPPAPVVTVPPALQQSLQVAFEAESDPLRSANVANLADLMQNIVAAAKVSGVKTHKDMQVKVHAATDLAIGPTALPKVRPAISAFLVTALPTNASGAVDDAYWTKADAAYAQVAAGLKGIKR